MGRTRSHFGRRSFLRSSLALAGLNLLAGCRVLAPRAPQTGRLPRVGFLGAASPSASRVEALREGLRELGYVEGENLVIEYRYAEGNLNILSELAADLVGLKVDIIVTAAPSSTRATKAATSTIPIVMAYDTDPVANGFAASLARPGGNITGMTSLALGISGKQLELLKEIVPGLSRVAVLGTSTLPVYAQLSKELDFTAAALGVQLQYLDVRGPEGIEMAFQEAGDGRAEAALVMASPILESDRTRVADLAAKDRLPTIYPAPEFVEAGGLMSYGVSWNDLYRRAAVYVDKILKGAKPADLPIEQPTKFELIINLKTARALGLTFPASVLQQATEVIQ